MENLKKTILLITGPGILLFEVVALFLHLFTPNNTRTLMIAGLIVFFVVFIPMYSIEYFRQEFKNDKSQKLRFKKKNTRTEWRGGNIHGKIPKKESAPGRFFNK